MVALLVSLGSMAVAVRALDRADMARDFALTARGQQPVTPATPQPLPSTVVETTEASAPVESTPATVPTSTAIPDLNPETRYNIKYEAEVLDLQWPNGCAPSERTNVDLDEPRVIVFGGPGIDLSLGRCGNSRSPNPDFELQGGAQGALITSPTATPQDCAERIQKGPLLPETNIPARQGQLFCVLTDFSSAQQAGDTRKMIRAEVKGVAANERVSIEITAWIIP
ncbi:hypothetical protein ACIA8K_15720 [Catenuloplanes sp. NPDC051500]|uniref:hypothetical protein n=1 Tax=Catenuloplanes sp. NPDC051500 TaxID=3363959 RepID=UPI0037AA308A